jgi:hypothetical protein
MDEFTEFERDIDTRVRATLPAPYPFSSKPVSPIFYELWWNVYFNKELEDNAK